MPRFRRFAPFLVLAVCTLLPAPPAQGTVYVPMSDAALADAAEVVALGHVVASAPALGDGTPVTEYLVELEAVFKGSPAGGTVPVRVLGGEHADGTRLELQGAPRFAVGERPLLFLVRGEGDGYWPLNLELGVFRTAVVDGRRFAFAAVEAAPEGAKSAARDLERFGTWIEDRAAGRHRESDYRVSLEPSRLGAAVDAFTPLRTGGNPTRWVAFDGGGSVPWRAHAAGQPGLAGGGFAQFQQALAAWTNDGGSRIILTYAGTTNSTNGFSKSDGINSLIFDQDLTGRGIAPFDCENGGVLAIGGPWTLGTVQHKGQTYAKAFEGEILTNKNVACWYASTAPPNASHWGTAADTAEMLAHETGHALGAGHSCDSNPATEPPSCASNAALEEALMRASLHGDGRGADLRADDSAFAAHVYPQPAATQPPAAPSNLTATGQTTTSLLLSWKDNAGDETGFKIEGRPFGGSFSQLGTAPANATGATIGGLAVQTLYEVRVRATNAKGDSPFSNLATAATNANPSGCTAPCFGGRFKVLISFRTGDGTTGNATISSLTSDTGYGWFFNAANVEVIFKLVEACGLGGHRWVFLAGLTNVQVIVQVVDTATGKVRTYVNPQGTAFAPVQDTSAFTC